MTEISSSIAARPQPCLRVAIIGALRIGDRKQKAFTAVEKTQAPHIGAKERPKPMRNPACEGYPAPGGDEHVGARRRIAIHAPDRVLDPQDGIMQERLGEAADR